MLEEVVDERELRLLGDEMDVFAVFQPFPWSTLIRHSMYSD